MKRIVCLLLLSVVLSSCASIVIPTPTATIKPTATATFTPTLTPTITPTPTETPDPNRPPDATGQDPVTGDYTKTIQENGNTVTYYWKEFQFGDDATNGIKGHWFESRMAKGPIDLTGYGENCREFWGKFSMKLNVFAVEGLADLDKIGYLYHPDGPSDYITKNFTCIAPPNIILTDLFANKHNLIPNPSDGGDSNDFSWNKIFEKAYYPSGTPTDEQKARFASDWQSLITGLNNGEGIQVGDQLWEPRKGYEVYWVTEKMVASDPTFRVSHRTYPNNDLYYKLVVNDGTLIAILAAGDWVRTQFQLPKIFDRESRFRWLVLYPLQMVIDGVNVKKDNPGDLPFQDYGNIMGPQPGWPNGGINTSWIAFTP